jgi:hypothetical protein
VQGALILGLNREDVVLPGDLALRKAVRDAYQLDHLPTPDEVLAIAERWRPHRSLATLYLFRAGESLGRVQDRRSGLTAGPQKAGQGGQRRRGAMLGDASSALIQPSLTVMAAAVTIAAPLISASQAACHVT